MSVRHRWLKIEKHRYVCRKCGTARENVLVHGQWRARWFPPQPHVFDVTSRPDCAPGLFTEDRIERLVNSLLDELRGDAPAHVPKSTGVVDPFFA